MSFTLHQVTRRLGGGEINRTRPLASESPLIGRGTDCDIHLRDLAAELRHARLSKTAAGRVRIEALGKHGFEVAGHFRRDVELDIGASAEVMIGHDCLTFSAGVGDETIVTLSRAVEIGNALARGDERAVFSPKPRFFGRRSLAWTFGLTILVGCLMLPIALFFAHGGHRMIQVDQQWTSGPLSKAHAFLQNDCRACHRQAFTAVRDDACLACHGAGRRSARKARPPADLVLAHAPASRLIAATPISGDLGERTRTMIAKAFNHPDDRCASCHLEHIAAGNRHPGANSTAEIPRNTPYLRTVNDCVGCHGALRGRLSDTVLRDTPSWAMHPDFRPYIAVFGASGRVEHRRINPIVWKRSSTGLIFSHRLHLLPTGGVARYAVELGAARGYGGALTCATCHRLDAKGRGFLPIHMERDCAACHSLAFARDAAGVHGFPHGSVNKMIAAAQSYFAHAKAGGSGGDNVRRRPGEVAVPPFPAAVPAADRVVLASFAPGGTCAFCHAVSRPPPRSLNFVVSPVPQLTRHLPAGAFDHGLAAHSRDTSGRPACGSCHAAIRSEEAADILLPSISRCAACHGRKVGPVIAKSDCAECHAYHDPGGTAAHGAGRPGSWRPPTRLVKSLAIGLVPRPRLAATSPLNAQPTGLAADLLR